MNELAKNRAQDGEARPNLKRRARIMAALIVVLILMGVNLAIGTDRLQIEKVISESMLPTLEINDRLLVDKNAVPKRYDIVIVNDPDRPGEKLVKRIIGMPDDLIVIDGGVLYVNGEEQFSRQVTDNTIDWRDLRVRVPLGKVFVLGDNRNNSYDSLNFGPVAKDQIRGVMQGIIWPPSRWRRAQPFE